jgi:predicted enzyme related to lactoylglutathione lyase
MKQLYIFYGVLLEGAARADARRGKPMDGRITVVSLVVTNQDRSLAFFTEKAGFEKKADVTSPQGYRWVTVGLKGQDLELALQEIGSAVDPTQREWSKSWAPGKAPPIVLAVPDCRKAHQEMSARGVEFTLAPFDHPWGTTATFKDPDGNLFSMNQPPTSWPKK